MRTGERESAPRGRPHRKLVPIDVILSSHAKKLEFFWTRISSLGRIKTVPLPLDAWLTHAAPCNRRLRGSSVLVVYGQ